MPLQGHIFLEPFALSYYIGIGRTVVSTSSSVLPNCFHIRKKQLLDFGVKNLLILATVFSGN